MVTLSFTAKPLSARPLHDWLPDTAETLVVIVDRASAESVEPAELRRRFRHVETVDDYQSAEVELAADRVHARFGVSRIVTASETDVLRASRLRTRFGLPGQSEASAQAYRDKYVMKTLAARSGVPVAPMVAVDTALDLVEFADLRGYPLVVKPRLGAGSTGVQRLDDEDDLLAFVESGAIHRPDGAAGGWLAEGFLHGALHHVDGIMSQGRILHAWPSAYLRGNADTLSRLSPLSSVMLDAADPRATALVAFTAEVVRALPSPSEPTSFHAEVFVADDESMTLCEIACRAGGAGVVPVYEMAFGAHLSAESLRGQAGAPLTLDSQPAKPRVYGGWVWFPPWHGRLVALPAQCPVPGVSYQPQAQVGEVHHGPRILTQAVAQALVTADDAGTLRHRVDEVERWWAETVWWEPAETGEAYP